MHCNVCSKNPCGCGPKTIFVPSERKVQRMETVMRQQTVQVAEKVPVVETVPCTARYERVSDGCAGGEMAMKPAMEHGMSTYSWMGGCTEWLMPWIFFVLPALILLIGALASLGANGFEWGPWTQVNPLRYAQWAFWVCLSIAAVMYGIFWGLLYCWPSTQSRGWLHSLISLPLWLGLAYIIVLYGCDIPVSATFLAFAMNAATIAVLAIVAGTSPYPEVSFLGAFFLAWGLYENAIVAEEAIARGP